MAFLWAPLVVVLAVVGAAQLLASFGLLNSIGGIEHYATSRYRGGGSLMDGADDVHAHVKIDDEKNGPNVTVNVHLTGPKENAATSIFRTDFLQRYGSGRVQFEIRDEAIKCPKKCDATKPPQAKGAGGPCLVASKDCSHDRLKCRYPKCKTMVTNDEWCRQRKYDVRQYFSEEIRNKGYLPLGPRFDAWTSFQKIRQASDFSTKPASRRKYAFNAIFSQSTNGDRKQLARLIKSQQGKSGLEVFTTMARTFNSHANRPKTEQLDTDSYARVLLDSVFTLAPAGHNPECFRLFEAAEAGSMPVVVRGDLNRTKPCKHSLFHWSDAPMVVLDSWSELYPTVSQLMETPKALDAMQANLRTWYGRYMRERVREFEDLMLEPNEYTAAERRSDEEGGMAESSEVFKAFRNVTNIIDADESNRHEVMQSTVEHVAIQNTVERREQELAAIYNRSHSVGYAREQGPSVLNENLGHEGVTIDVLSIGSERRFDYLTAQLETWAAHANIRNFWGVTERQDFELGCPSMSDEAVGLSVKKCRTMPLGSSEETTRIRRWAREQFAITHGESRATAGWVCAQRRPGRALGWLQKVYRNESTSIPDILLIVDDDSSMDIEKVKKFMVEGDRQKAPFSSGGCLSNAAGFTFPDGGFGTFINGAALQSLMQPIFCDERGDGSFMASVCSSLQENRMGERESFQEGDSVFDLFYKYSAREDFCLHSDWAVGYMLEFYSNGGKLRQIEPRLCKDSPCTVSSVSCHKQTPTDMAEFASAHNPNHVKEKSVEAQGTKPQQSEQVLPNILFLGAQKTGSSSVADWLFRQGVCGAQVFAHEPSWYKKEVQFFHQNDRYEQGIGFYAKRFQHCAKEGKLKYVMDADTNAFLHPDRVYETYRQAASESLSNLKLMVTLREPLSRDLSMYNHMTEVFSKGRKSMKHWTSGVANPNGTVMSFEDYSHLVLKPRVSQKDRAWTGKYVDLLQRWNELFGRDRLLVLSYDELQQDPEKLQWRVNNFLGSNFTKTFKKKNTKNSKGKVSVVPDSVKHALGPLYASKNEELYEFLDAHKGPWMEQRPFPRFDSYGATAIESLPLVQAEDFPEGSNKSLLVLMSVMIRKEDQIAKEIRWIQEDSEAVCAYYSRCEWNVNVVVAESAASKTFEEACKALPSNIHLHLRTSSTHFSKYVFVQRYALEMASYDLVLLKDNDQRINSFSWRTFIEKRSNAVISGPLRRSSGSCGESGQWFQINEACNYERASSPEWSKNMYNNVDVLRVPFLEQYFVLFEGKFASFFFSLTLRNRFMDSKSAWGIDTRWCQAAKVWDEGRPGCHLVPVVSVHEDTRQIDKQPDMFRKNGLGLLKAYKADPIVGSWLSNKWTHIVGSHKNMRQIDQGCRRLLGLDANDPVDIHKCSARAEQKVPQDSHGVLKLIHRELKGEITTHDAKLLNNAKTLLEGRLFNSTGTISQSRVGR